MLEFWNENPWLVIPCLALCIPILGVVFGTVTNYLASIRKAEIEASLKQDMLQRGMSAEEIKTVLEATSQRKRKWCNKHDACSRS